MKFDADILPFLHGSKFSNSLKVRVNYLDQIPDRVSFLVNLIKGKSVVHLGCLDHKPLIEDKIKRKKWLHKELTENASRCIGIDIDKDAWNYVRETFGFNNIFISDFTSEKLSEVHGKEWDFAILGELLEHIDNPVAFLKSIRENYHGSIRKIVITVPNAFTQTTFKMAAKSIEIINSDHRYWFTPYTLAKVMYHAGINVDEIYFANRVPLSKKQLAVNKLLKMLGQPPRYNFTYASSIVAVGNL